MSKAVTKIWETINTPVLNNIKVYLLQYHVSDILRFYTVKVDYVVNKYAKYLPNYVVESEIDDLKTVAKLELLETLKVWDPGKADDIWPLAQQRIIGAMKDHIRYITKSDPSRFYEWVSDAAYFYMAVKDRADFATEIENGMELNKALKDHWHISTMPGMRTSPSPEVLLTATQTILRHLQKTKMSLRNNRTNLQNFEKNYLSEGGAGYINSRYNKVN